MLGEEELEGCAAGILYPYVYPAGAVRSYFWSSGVDGFAENRQNRKS